MSDPKEGWFQMVNLCWPSHRKAKGAGDSIRLITHTPVPWGFPHHQSPGAENNLLVCPRTSSRHLWGYPQSSSIDGFSIVNPTFLGYPHVWKPPNSRDLNWWWIAPLASASTGPRPPRATGTKGAPPSGSRCSPLHGLVVPSHLVFPWLDGNSSIQCIGLRENLQEKSSFDGTIYGFLWIFPFTNPMKHLMHDFWSLLENEHDNSWAPSCRLYHSYQPLLTIVNHS